MLHPEASPCESSSSLLKLIGRRQCVVPFLLAILVCLSFSAAGQALVPGSDAAVAPAPQAQKTLEKGTAPTENPLAPIQSAVGNLHSPSLQALAGALGLSPAQIGRQQFEDSSTGMEEISGLGEAGAPAVAVKWQRAGGGQNPQVGSAPKVYLLSWDGKNWQASYLVVSSDALTLEVLPAEGSEASLFAVIIYRDVTAVPYPVIFRFQDHHAALVWDGRADSSSYTGYNYGSIEFKKAGGGSVPAMVVAGQADPGLLSFPASQEDSGRGFQVATAYIWKNGAYVPIRQEYTRNRDYVLYSFIAALHLHDYQKAYSLVDPGQFLRTKKPNLKLFRERIQNAWPEFIDDKIFEVPVRREMDTGGQTFVLKLGSGKMNVYDPTFTPGPDYRLTGLSRTESNY
ncbi:MAG TPA: hypothetical protein VFL79_05435 [Terriglobia bacterium]|nr:hypothetical protein [Terriglobia bacterium]